MHYIPSLQCTEYFYFQIKICEKFIWALANTLTNTLTNWCCCILKNASQYIIWYKWISGKNTLNIIVFSDNFYLHINWFDNFLNLSKGFKVLHTVLWYWLSKIHLFLQYRGFTEIFFRYFHFFWWLLHWKVAYYVIYSFFLLFFLFKSWTVWKM